MLRQLRHIERCRVRGLVRALLAASLCCTHAVESPMEPVTISDDGAHFALAESGKPFVPWGFNYDHDIPGRLIEDYWVEEWDTVVADFSEMKDLGANVVRVHLQTAKFMATADKPNDAALTQLAKLVELAEDTGLYLDLTGLGCYHKQDLPAWFDALPETERWDTQARFWEAVAETCADSDAVFCYDLMNEPVLPGAEKKETEWLLGELGGKFFVQRLALDLAGRTREEVAAAWVGKMAGAIRKHDRRHLVTLGIIPWAHHFHPGARKSIFYTGEAGKHLEFVSVHFYPKKGEVEKALDALTAYAVGKPVVIEEMFPLKCSADELEAFIDGSRKTACGWISFYWGKTIDEYAADEGNLVSAIMADWLKRFQVKGAAIRGDRPALAENGGNDQ